MVLGVVAKLAVGHVKAETHRIVRLHRGEFNPPCGQLAVKPENRLRVAALRLTGEHRLCLLSLPAVHEGD
jgi:hypothetical protein